MFLTNPLSLQFYPLLAKLADNFYDDAGKIAIAVVLLSLCMYALVPEISHEFKRLRSQNWPRVNGTVQKGEVLHSGPARYLQLPFRSLLGYAYQVNGASYWGLFVVPVNDMWEAEVMQKRALGKLVTVKYDPKRPGVSLLADREICGRRITQHPTWLS